MTPTLNWFFVIAQHEIIGCSRDKISLRAKISAYFLLDLEAFKEARLEVAAVCSFQMLPCFMSLRLEYLIVEGKD